MAYTQQTYFSAQTDPEASFQCRHIHIDGRRCGSPCLRNEVFCYYHHTTRKPVPPSDLAARKARGTDFAFPIPDERSAIQAAIGGVLLRIASNEIDVKRAGLLLYGLQIASLNLPRPRPDSIEDPIVEDIVQDPILGTLAPVARVATLERYKGPAARFLEKLEQEEAEAARLKQQQREAEASVSFEADPYAPLTIQAAADDGCDSLLNRHLKYTGTMFFGGLIRMRVAYLGCVLVLSPLGLRAQTATPVPAPSPIPVAAPKHPDWAQLDRYEAANAALPATQKGRVVFYGDSITDAWASQPDLFFPGKPFVGRGISGQTTPQMLVRFRQDVIDLHPEAVVILAGTNDVAGNTGPMTPEMTEENLMSMAELARAHKIKVVLCSIMPVLDYPWRKGLEPSLKIRAINTWMKAYAAQQKFAYVDYYTAMDDGTGAARPGLTYDGVHPTAEGYKLMEHLALAGIEAK